jgi:hypothetical protein
MEISHLERPTGYHYLIVKITRDSNVYKSGLDENSIIDGLSSEMLIVKGYKLEEKISLQRCMPNL